MHELINTYICRDDIDNLLNTLNQSSSLNVDSNKYFNIAIESGNIAIVEALLNYFETNQLVRFTEGTLKFLVLKKKMHDILEVAVEDLNISQEMKKILFSYVNFIDKNDESDQDLPEFDNEEFITSDQKNTDHGSFYFPLTETNLNLFNDDNSYSTSIIGQNQPA